MTHSRRQTAGIPIADLLSYGFRPFFLGAAIWSIVALVIWAGAFMTGTAIPSHFDPLAWHVHEMLFGFIAAAVAGFLLTAIPNWTGRLPVQGRPLAMLVLLWLLGRIVLLFSADIPAVLTAAIDLAFPAMLIAVGARELVAGRNWRNLVMLAPISVFGIANLLMHMEAAGLDVPAGLGWRLGLGAVLVLIAVIGGRIIPSFTRNWLAKQRDAGLPPPFGRIDRLSLVGLVIALAAWIIWPEQTGVGAGLLAVAALHLLRLGRWRGAATIAEPLLLILHVGYAWLVLGLALLGLASVGLGGPATGVPQSAAIHALTAGAAATMILAVMTRATRGHTGRDLTADRPTIVLYGLVTLSAIARVLAAFLPDLALPLLEAAALLWVAAFGLFVVAYGGMLVGPRVPPRPELTQMTESAR